ncbi:hypothetical protein [Methyloversatilis universalis]|uniref:hypothetical protein n=1 Tax=Methyloversatilis universalis TaxID=378211 RepID=UPI00035D4C83|nr:hypothetical protein [Methyloversatilis universalis]
MTDSRDSSSPETDTRRNDGNARGPQEEGKKQGGGKKQNREKSIRWQSNTIQQMGHANNLLLAFAVATMGFEFNLLVSQPPERLHSLVPGFAISLVFLGLSFVVGVLVTVNRLEDFRQSAAAARADEDNDAAAHAVHSARAKELGPKTKSGFTAQLCTFGIGLLVGVITLVILVLHRIY